MGAISPDDRWAPIVLSNNQQQFGLVDLTTGQFTKLAANPPSGLWWSPDGRFAIYNESSRLMLFDTQQLTTTDIAPQGLLVDAFDSDGAFLRQRDGISGSDIGSIDPRAAACDMDPRVPPGREVRLRSAYFITCTDVIKDASGTVVELHCTYDAATRGGDSPDGRRPKATLHWLPAAQAVPAEVRLYDHLFADPFPGADGGDLFAGLDRDSETVLAGALVEPSLGAGPVGETVQFERLGYFSRDPDSTSAQPVFNRTLTLKDTWAKVQAQARP